jgi:hypothetical protein
MCGRANFLRQVPTASAVENPRGTERTRSTEDGALMEPSGRNPAQRVANALARQPLADEAGSGAGAAARASLHRYLIRVQQVAAVRATDLRVRQLAARVVA